MKLPSPGSRTERIFDEAADLPEEERAAFVRIRCADDPDLRREVEELLAASATGEAWFSDLEAAWGRNALGELDASLQAGLRIGPYRAIRPLGRGGMGAVYLAERVDGQFRRHVAVKLLHLDLHEPDLRERFLSERQLLAELDHPSIAKLLDGGITPEGRPYLVLEWIDGQPITDFAEKAELDLRGRLRLFLQVVEAVAHLHGRLVVHRDLKPSNILVDREGRARILDFGIAKLLDAEGDSARTATARRWLTPAYSAPEQAEGAPVTTAVDVFGLGAVLYELLTGRRARDAATSPRSDSGRLVGTERWAEAILPPSVVPREASGSPLISSRDLAGDLDAIVLTALAPEPERRYRSAEGLGRDLERHLEGQPIRARRASIGDRIVKLVRRRRIEVLSAALVFLVLVVSLVREHGLRAEAERARGNAQEEAARSEAVSTFLRDLFFAVDPRRAQGREPTVSDVLDQAAARLEEDSGIATPAAEAEIRLTLGRTYTALSRFDAALGHLERALELYGGRESTTPEAIDALEALGVLRYRSGERDEETEDILRRVLSARRARAAPDEAEILATLGHLANLYWYQDRIDDAERLDRERLALGRAALGDEHPTTLRALHGLGTTLYARGDYPEAAPLFEEAYLGQRRLLGPDHPDTLGSANALASCLDNLGRSLEGLELLRDVAERRARVFGDDHSGTVTSRHNLGLALLRAGRPDEAEPILRSVVRAREEEGAREGTLLTRSFLADAYRDSGETDRAESLYRETIRDQEALLGPEHAHPLRTHRALARLLLDDRRLGEARQHALAALEGSERLGGDEHPETFEARLLVARIELALGRTPFASELVDTILERGPEALGRFHPTIDDARLLRAETLAREGRFEEADRLVEEVVARLRERLGEDHPRTLGLRLRIRGSSEAQERRSAIQDAGSRK